MDRNEFDDQDAQAAWELLGRHRGIEPSFGFAQRTLRRLHEIPAEMKRHFWQLPVFRWATALSCVAVMAVGGLVIRHRAEARRNAEAYAAAHQDDLEDYDVIAALDQLAEEGKL